MEINNYWDTQVVQILTKELDSKCYFKGNLICRPPNTVEQSQDWVLTNFNYQESLFYAILFDEYE